METEIARLAAASGPEEPSAFDLDALAGRWSDLETKDRRRIAEILVEKLVVGEGEIEIHYRFDDSSKPPDRGSPEESNESEVRSLRSLKDATSSRQTRLPTNAGPATTTDEPIFIRLPKPGERCARTGLSRTALNELILPLKRNGYSPPVKSKTMRKAGQQRGIRLILWESLRAYLEKERE